MARHNREGKGTDQRGFEYSISYPPDWLRHVKIGRTLPGGRRSTMTLFRNPLEAREADPGERVRTRITCPEQGVDVEVAVRCREDRVCRIVVTCEVPSSTGKKGTAEEISFVIEDGLPPAPRSPRSASSRR